MWNRRHFLWLTGATLLSACANTPGSAVSQSTIEALRGGGHVLYFRHGATNWKGSDSQTWPREEQRLLSETGIAQSRRIGARLQALGIPVAEVLASPFYRCTEMGEHAFGRVSVEERLVSPTNPASRGRSLPFLKRIVATPRPDQGNLVLISHTTNIKLAFGITLAEGEAAIFRPQGAAGSVFLGQIKADDW